ncbi:MAG: UDP-glucose 4-epimerase GalE [Ruminococcaceae bacterium]|nr:UDP-glucose 4-epimerase GalE [Oscillospiraceae bacterium]
MSILLTGGAGYIGSHTLLELLKSDKEVIVADNFVNSSEESIKRVEELTGKRVVLYEIDLCNEADTFKLFEENPELTAIVHFAGLKAVGESVMLPLKYYKNNILSTLNLLSAMEKYEVKNFVFSSSATVYGDPDSVPIKEDFPLRVTNPYGRTKLIIEDILRDFYNSDNSYNIALLRYFNPIGADISGRIGEDPLGIPNNLLPRIAKVAVGEESHITVFGNDYPTKDGTGVRDYLHVTDLAIGHLLALDKLDNNPGLITVNLGTGIGYSVFDIISAFSEACGFEIPYVITPRRPGDIAECYADPTLAKDLLGWTAKRNLKDMCDDSWRWIKNNPNGYR